MPVTWEAFATLDLPFRDWIRTAEVEFSERFRLQFTVDNWADWKKRHSGGIVLRPVYYLDGGGTEIGEDKLIWIDDSPEPRVVTLPFPPGYQTSGITRRSLDIYRYPKVRRPEPLSVSVVIEKS
ncbi:MAG: hypothetical protein ACFB9N_05100 [Geitlerinemataceae cyanobacterium]